VCRVSEYFLGGARYPGTRFEMRSEIVLVRREDLELTLVGNLVLKA
jgi:hypothetical protein